MTLEQYWTILIKRWQLVVICFLLVGGGAFAGSKLMKPLYQSSALVQVVIRSGNNNQADYNNLLASDELVQTEATLTTSDTVLREVASHYPGLTASQLGGEISSSPRTSTQLFEIDAIDLSPTRAKDLANDTALTLIKQQAQEMQQENTQARQQIQQNIDLTQQQIDETTSKISTLQARGGNAEQVALLQIQLSGLVQHYNQWQTALAQLELTQAQSGNPLRLAQSAQISTYPVRPNIPLNTGGGLLAGLLLGMLLVVLFERLDTGVRTPQEMGRLLGWPVLATIWRTDSSNPEDLINPKGNNANVEAYRILRTNIGFSGIDNPLRSLIVTSAMPHDGKSTIAANLAIFMARAGKQTLLIDADLRRPTQHTLFGLSEMQMGLTNGILAFSMSNIPDTPTDRIPSIPDTPNFQQPSAPTQKGVSPSATTRLSLEPFVQSVGISNLWVMPSGPLPPNPPELLDSKAMQCFLKVIADAGVEIVIFDAAPLLSLSDASILASKVEGALVVVDTAHANKGRLKEMKAVLLQTGVHVIGCVANKQRLKRKDMAYSYYYNNDLAEKQNGQENHTGNGHTPRVPVTPALPVFPSPLDRERSQARTAHYREE